MAQEHSLVADEHILVAQEHILVARECILVPQESILVAQDYILAPHIYKTHKKHQKSLTNEGFGLIWEIWTQEDQDSARNLIADAMEWVPDPKTPLKN